MNTCLHPENAHVRRLFTLSGLTLREIREATHLYDKRSSERWMTGGIEVPSEVLDYLQETIQGYLDYSQEVVSSIENQEVQAGTEFSSVTLMCYHNETSYRASNEPDKDTLTWNQYNARLNILYTILISRGHHVQWVFDGGAEGEGSSTPGAQLPTASTESTDHPAPHAATSDDAQS